MGRRRRAAGALALVGLAVLAACSEAEPIDLAGTTVVVLGPWQDDEADRFTQVLDVFERRTGATVSYVSTEGRDMAAVLDERLAAGSPPDVAILPQPGLLRRLAAEEAIAPIDDVLDDEDQRRFNDTWLRLASVDDRLYGVWFKAANKSVVWYAVGAFEGMGLVPPVDLEGFLTIARTLTAAGLPAFSVAGADAWTLTDWFENAYLRLAGPERYDALAEGRLPWSDESVVEVLELLGDLLAPEHLAGGPAAAVERTFPESVLALAERPPRAAMVVGADFVRGALAPTDAELGIDVDVFPFPEVDRDARVVVAGGDVAVLTRSGHGGEVLLRFLATPDAGEVWAALGGFLSPNEEVDLRSYPDATTRTMARSLLEAGDGLRFDLSDVQPVEFGGTSGAGMLAIFRDFLLDPGDAAGTAARLEAASTAVSGG